MEAMAKVKFSCNSGANYHSCRSETLDTVSDLGLDEGEWELLEDDEKYKEAEKWAFSNGLEIYYEDIG